jgi:hypothetical protein
MTSYTVVVYLMAQVFACTLAFVMLVAFQGDLDPPGKKLLSCFS